MNNIEIGKRIKEIRLTSGISQDELSEISQLNMRTIQRIENCKTKPRGDSLKRIALALKVDINDLTTDKIESEIILKEEKWIIRLLGLVTFAFLISPPLGIILPLILWIIYKDKSINVNETGKQTLKFQIAWCVVLFVIYLYTFSNKYFHLNLPVPNNQKSFQIIILILYSINILFCAIAILISFEIKKGILHTRNKVRFEKN